MSKTTVAAATAAPQTAGAPDFHVLQVVGRQWLSPHLLRITLEGESLAAMACADELPGAYLKLLLPLPGEAAPRWPRFDQGRPFWDDGRRPPLRTYSLRWLDRCACRLAVDVVLHGEDSAVATQGIGSAWARRACVGDRIGVHGPSGRPLSFAPSRWLLFGDHTALPAVAAILERMPPSAQGLACIQVPSPQERLCLHHPAGVELIWLDQRVAPAAASNDDTSPLLRWVSGLEAPPAGAYVWGGAEARTARGIRARARGIWGLPADQVYVLNYWRAGVAEGGFRYSD